MKRQRAGDFIFDGHTSFGGTTPSCETRFASHHTCACGDPYPSRLPGGLTLVLINGATAVCIQREDALNLQPSWLHPRFLFVVVPSQARCYFWVTGTTAPPPCRPLAPIGLPVVRETVGASSDRWRSHPCEHVVGVAETLRGFPARKNGVGLLHLLTCLR